MNAETLTHVAVIAQHFDDSAVWDKDGFRFKHHDAISNGALQQFRHYSLVEKDDTWSTPTWNWTQEASYAIEMCKRSPITEATQEQLDAILVHADRIIEMPLSESFTVADFADKDCPALRGQALQTLSERGIIEKADSSGDITVWQLSTLLVRILNSLEAQLLA